jgi:hypothetical protein
MNSENLKKFLKWEKWTADDVLGRDKSFESVPLLALEFVFREKFYLTFFIIESRRRKIRCLVGR